MIYKPQRFQEIQFNLTISKSLALSKTLLKPEDSVVLFGQQNFKEPMVNSMNICEIASKLNTSVQLFMNGRLVIVSLSNCYIHEDHTLITAMETGRTVKEAMEKLAHRLKATDLVNKKGVTLKSLEGLWFRTEENVSIPPLL